MAITLHGTPKTGSQGFGSGSTTITVTLPTGLSAGDIVIIFFGTTGGSAVTTPSGYTVPTGGDQAFNNSCDTFYQRYAGAPPASVAVTVATISDNYSWIATAYSGTDPTTPVDVSAGNTDGGTAATSFTSSSLTWKVNDMVLRFYAAAANAADTGFGATGEGTKQASIYAAGAGGAVYSDSLKASAASGTGSMAIAGSPATAVNWCSSSVALLAAPAAAPQSVSLPSAPFIGNQPWNAAPQMLRQQNVVFRAANLPDPYRQSMPPVPAWQQGMAPWQAPIILMQATTTALRAANLPDPYRYSMVPIPAWQAGMQQWWAPIALMRATTGDVPLGNIEQRPSQLPIAAIQGGWWAPVSALQATVTPFSPANLPDPYRHSMGPIPAWQQGMQGWWAPVFALHPTITELRPRDVLDVQVSGFPFPAIQQGWQLQYVRIPPYGPNDIGIIAIPPVTPTRFPQAAIQQGWWAPVQQFGQRSEQFGGIKPGPAVNRSVLLLMLPSSAAAGGDPIVVWRHRAGMQ